MEKGARRKVSGFGRPPELMWAAVLIIAGGRRPTARIRVLYYLFASREITFVRKYPNKFGILLTYS